MRPVRSIDAMPDVAPECWVDAELAGDFARAWQRIADDGPAASRARALSAAAAWQVAARQPLPTVEAQVLQPHLRLVPPPPEVPDRDQVTTEAVPASEPAHEPAVVPAPPLAVTISRVVRECPLEELPRHVQARALLRAKRGQIAMVLATVAVIFVLRALIPAIGVVAFAPVDFYVTRPAAPLPVEATLDGKRAVVDEGRIEMVAVAIMSPRRYEWWWLRWQPWVKPSTEQEVDDGDPVFVSEPIDPGSSEPPPGGDGGPPPEGAGVPPPEGADGPPQEAVPDGGPMPPPGGEVGGPPPDEGGPGAEHGGTEQRDESMRNAVIVAATLARVPLHVSGGGALVVDGAGTGVSSGSVIVEANGKPVRTTHDLERIAAAAGPGTRLNVRFGHGSSATWKLPRRTSPNFEASRGVGLFTSTADPVVKTSPELAFTMDKSIVGGSAGLPLALYGYSLLSGADLTGGRYVVASGGIDEAGTVTPVADTDVKGKAASDAGADVFLVHHSNVREARRFAGDMRVVGVGTVQEAIEFLATGRVPKP